MTRTRLLVLAVVAALVGCGGTDNPTPDGGLGGDAGSDASTMPDAGRDSGSAGGVCDDARSIALTVGANEITGDTTGLDNDLELGGDCGNPETARAPQEAVAITLPGSGPMGVRFSLVNDGTSAEFDTIVQLRRGGCEVPESAEGCFEWDDVDYPAETRSGGAFLAEGGDTLHLIVSGYDDTQSGPWQADVTVVEDPTAPTQTATTIARIDGQRLEFETMGGDVDSDADGLLVTFLDDAGADIGLDLDGDATTPPVTELFFGFDEPVIGMATFTATSTVAGIDDFAELVTAPQARVKVVDVFGLESAPLTVSITDLMESGRGEPCTTGYVCAEGLECTADVCTIPAAIVTYCAGATPLAITPGAATTTASVTGTVAAGPGMLEGSCGNTAGNEALYSLVIPALVAPVTAYDLIATTDTEETADSDTVLYAVGTCGDAETQLQCSDDIEPGTNAASSIEARDLAAGTYTIFVEGYGILDDPMSFGLDVTLRPVLAAGTACDPAGVTNRCAGGACPAATMLCP